MATIFSHDVAAIAMGRLYAGREKMSPAFWVTVAVCAILPDADVIGFRFGIHYGDLLGHRGLSHSLLAAVIIGLIAAFILKKYASHPYDYGTVAVFLIAVTMSHDLLDAMTNGGLGVAFFSPFNPRRYFLAWRPIEVSPIGTAFFSPRGWKVLASEARWIWIPSCILYILGWLL
jgi:inner membrane protein